MQVFDVKKFLDAYHLLVSVSAAIHNREDVQRQAFDRAGSDLVVQHAQAFVPQLEELGLRMSAITAQHVLGHMNKGSSMLEVKGQIERLHGRLNDELRVRTVLIVPAGKDAFYGRSIPIFGQEIADKFPNQLSDMFEAGNCFALGRNTACVFHLMRVMEAAVQVFGTKLGINLADELNWQNILDQLNPPIKAMDKSNPLKKVYASIQANLYHVKVAWRNEVMHPKATYDEPEAQRIINAVQAFLSDLARVL